MASMSVLFKKWLLGTATAIPKIVLTAGTALIGKVAQDSDFPYGATPFASSTASTANTAKTITVAAAAGKSHYISSIDVVVTGAATGATPIGFKLSQDVGGTEVILHRASFVASAAIGSTISIQFPKPIKVAVGKTADLVMDAGGAASCVLIGNIVGYTL